MKKLILIAASLCALATGCGESSAPAADPATDSGIAWCKELAATAAAPPSAGDGAAPTDAVIKQARQHWTDSSYSDLKRAGLSHLDAVVAYYDGKGQLQDVVAKRSVLDATCAAHGIVITQSTPTFSIPTVPTVDPVMPTNPYAK